MRHLEDLIATLAGGLPGGLGGPESGVRVESTTVDLMVPVETHVDGGGLVRATLPRGRLATGWDPLHSRLTIGFERRLVDVAGDLGSGRGGQS
jgi:hypothetical protein